jgi:hypothetical protein
VPVRRFAAGWDYVREGLNQIFKFNNPKAQHACGCGESFGVEYVNLETELQHPLGFVTFGRNGTHHIFIDAVCQFVGLCPRRPEPDF